MRITKKTIELLKERKIYTLMHSYSCRLREGEPLNVDNDAKIEAYSAILAGNKLHTIGTQSYTWSPLLRSTAVGRYTSLASDIRFIGEQHPYQRFTQAL